MSGRSYTTPSHKLDMSYILNSGEERMRHEPMDIDVSSSVLGRRPSQAKGERKHVCSHCRLRFLSRGDMQKHIRSVHLGIKPHECPTCGTKFAEKGNLTKHVKRHEGVREFKCNFPNCSKTFVLRDGLIRHEKDVHHLDDRGSSSKSAGGSAASARRRSSHHHASSRPRK